MTAVVWDTTIASRLRPGSVLLDRLDLLSSRDEPVRVAAVSLLEISYGLRKAADAGRADFGRLHDWFRAFASSGRFSVVAMGAEAALLAGEVRAMPPVPPVGGARRTRSKAEARVVWSHDISIACTAWGTGCDIATVDVAHFAEIVRSINALVGQAPPLGVTGAPEDGAAGPA